MQDYENDRQTMLLRGAYERANYFDMMVHGNWYCYVPELNGVDSYSQGVRNSDMIPYWAQNATRIEIYGTKGLMIVGRVRVELYEYMPASGDRKGRRLEQWNIELTTAKQQRAHWSSLTQMYEWQLGLDPASIPRADKYILAVTYDSPLGERLTDECVIHYRAGPVPLGTSPPSAR